MPLNFLDWTVLCAYLAAMVGLSVTLAHGQKTSRDYYLAGNKTAPLPIALSTIATQCSTNSLIGAPAFVAFATGGGILWLQYELAVPFAMIFLMAVLFPVFRRLNLISLYSFLEKRFGPGTRVTMSIIFQFLRAFSTGVTVYGVSLVLKVCLGIPFWTAVMLLGGITIIYDTLGGMKAVIWSDVVQLIVLFVSILAAIGVAVSLVGGFQEVLGRVDPDRLHAVDFAHHGLGDGHTFAFWPMLLGGLFLYVSYYGCDQTQAQRELSTRSVGDTNRALFLDGMLRFPLVASYCLLGICLAAYAAANPEFLKALPLNESGETNYNYAVPIFVLQHFPHGIIGLVMVGLLAAAMSSLDSTLNALSALSMEDVVKRYTPMKFSPRLELLASKMLTVFWGSVCIFFAFYVGDISETVIESVNKIGSIINGPLLAVFLMGVLSRRINSRGAVSGFVTGFVVNLLLWEFAPQFSWLWWNVIGFVIAYLAGYLVSKASPTKVPFDLENTFFRQSKTAAQTSGIGWRFYYIVLAVYGTGIFLFMVILF
ncbi:MAG: sodium:solute symporter [Deltaproteobacteria bacterium]|nr:MAG: sodium:solute symporter [Deltaproteobacteria bacterium]